MFAQTLAPPQPDFEHLRHAAPEELHFDGPGRRETTVSWRLGAMLFEAHYGQAPFATHLSPKIMAKLILKYPLHFPVGPNFVLN